MQPHESIELSLDNNLLSLPNEILTSILVYLNARDLCRLGTTSKEFLAFTQNNHFWFQFYIQTKPSQNRVELIYSSANDYKNLLFSQHKERMGFLKPYFNFISNYEKAFPNKSDFKKLFSLLLKRFISSSHPSPDESMEILLGAIFYETQVLQKTVNDTNNDDRKNVSEKKLAMEKKLALEKMLSFIYSAGQKLNSEKKSEVSAFLLFNNHMKEIPKKVFSDHFLDKDNLVAATAQVKDTVAKNDFSAVYSYDYN